MGQAAATQQLLKSSFMPEPQQELELATQQQMGPLPEPAPQPD
jgi:hypothetical protein